MHVKVSLFIFIFLEIQAVNCRKIIFIVRMKMNFMCVLRWQWPMRHGENGKTFSNTQNIITSYY